MTEDRTAGEQIIGEVTSWPGVEAGYGNAASGASG